MGFLHLKTVHKFSAKQNTHTRRACTGRQLQGNMHCLVPSHQFMCMGIINIRNGPFTGYSKFS